MPPPLGCSEKKTATSTALSQVTLRERQSASSEQCRTINPHFALFWDVWLVRGLRPGLRSSSRNCRSGNKLLLKPTSLQIKLYPFTPFTPRPPTVTRLLHSAYPERLEFAGFGAEAPKTNPASAKAWAGRT